MINFFKENQKDIAMLIARILIGIVFIAHGINKFQIGINTISGLFASVGIPASQFFAWIVAFVEIIGGIALILGIFSRIFALIFSIILLVAIIKIKFSVGIISPIAQPGVGMELDLALLAGLAPILFQGGGKYSLSKIIAPKFFKKKQSEVILGQSNLVEK